MACEVDGIAIEDATWLDLDWLRNKEPVKEPRAMRPVGPVLKPSEYHGLHRLSSPRLDAIGRRVIKRRGNPPTRAGHETVRGFAGMAGLSDRHQSAQTRTRSRGGR